MQPKIRCGWCKGDDLYEKYHDEEWGRPVSDDDKLYEFILLETFQTGLSWITILRKRENFRAAFDNFEYRKIAEYNEDKIASLLQDAGIIRNRLKILSAVRNAKAFINVQDEFGSFSSYYWSFTNGRVIDNCPDDLKNIPATTPLSDIISKDLKKRGFNFVGPTIIYATLQATGVVNDHVADCWTRE